jgi:adenine deaminase
MKNYFMTIKGNRVSILESRIDYSEIIIENGIIQRITLLQEGPLVGAPFILPGFIDSHVHIESSMLVPAEFARLAVVHGTVATISDPHEIANVCGVAGVDFMIENGKQVPFKFHFGAPSCVPATIFETAGAAINSEEVDALLSRKDIYYLSEMMNYPGVLQGDSEVMKKIASAHKWGKPVDGHAPGLRGETARKYIAAGISTDHECFTAAEALDKLQHGMKILIREGSAAKNFDALIELLYDYPEQIMFCSDDKHPDSLVESHINALCARAIQKGLPLFAVLRAACINPVLHYSMQVGLLREGDSADCILVSNLQDFRVLATYINGCLVAENGVSLIQANGKVTPINAFEANPVSIADLSIPSVNYPSDVEGSIPVMQALDGQLITPRIYCKGIRKADEWICDPTEDLLKIVVVNRYHPAPIAKAFVQGFGLKKGAIASSVAHDSHNIVAVGVDDESIAAAINLVIQSRGGVSCVNDGDHLNGMIIALPIGGLMSVENGYRVAERYTAIDQMAKNLGSLLSAPFMTLSFMALLVIPHIKLSDRGLFNGDDFSFLTTVS